MCGVPLQCPLCCNESFASQDALKNHLLVLSENIVCKVCNFKYETIAGFARHIGNECNKNLNTTILYDKEQENSSSITAPQNTGMEEWSNIDLKEEIVTKQVVNDSKEVLFHCNTCNKNFVSIGDHLKTFHKNHEVFVEKPKSNEELVEKSTESPSTVQDSCKTITKDDIESQIKSMKIIKIKDVESGNKVNECSDKTEKTNKKRKWNRKEPIVKKICLKNNSQDKGEKPDLKMINVYQCPLCPLYYYTISGYKQHKCHDMKCVFCDLSFSNMKSYKNHEEVHKHLQVLTPLKVLKLVNEQGRNRGENDADSTIKKKMVIVTMFHCKVCNKWFDKKNETTHNNTHNFKDKEKNVDPVAYDENNKSKLSECSLDHLSNECQDRQNECPTEVVNKQIINREEKKAVSSIKNLNVQKFYCKFCNKWFDKENEKAHSNLHNPDKKIKKDTEKEDKDKMIKIKDKEKNVDPVAYDENNKSKLSDSSLDHLSNECQDRQNECLPKMVNIQRRNRGENNADSTIKKQTVIFTRFYCKCCKKWFDKENEKAHSNLHIKKDKKIKKDTEKEDKDKTITIKDKGKNVDPVAYDENTKSKLSESSRDHLSNECQDKQNDCLNKAKLLVCEVCQKSFALQESFTLHMRTHLQDDRMFSCLKCGGKFKGLSIFHRHQMTHVEDQKYKCPFCPKSFSIRKRLSVHKYMHTKSFLCSECKRDFTSLKAMQKHQEDHKREGYLKYICEDCGAAYATFSGWRDHNFEKHEIVSTKLTKKFDDENEMEVDDPNDKNN